MDTTARTARAKEVMESTAITTVARTRPAATRAAFTTRECRSEFIDAPTRGLVNGTRRTQGKHELTGNEQLRRLAAATLCRVSEALARDSSPSGLERALAENQTRVKEIDRVVERYGRITLALRTKGIESCRFNRVSPM